MSIDYRPKISSYFSNHGAKEVEYEIEKRKRQLETSREIVAKNIILPAIARFQFAERVDIDYDGKVNYTNIDINLFFDGWESFRPALPSYTSLKRELRGLGIKEEEYDSFLKKSFDELQEKGFIERRVETKEVDLVEIGDAYEAEPGVLKSVKTGEIIPSRTKVLEKTKYSLKEGSDWHELLRKVFSHENPIGISFDDFYIGYDPYRTFYENLRPFYLDFNEKLGRVKDFKEREVDRKDTVDPNLVLRLMRLHSNLMEIYQTATGNVVKKSSKSSQFVTLRPPYILDAIVDSLPSRLGVMYYDISELSKETNFSWLKQFKETVDGINSRELGLKYLARMLLRLEKDKGVQKAKGEPMKDYPEVKNVLDEVVFKGLVPFVIPVRSELEHMLGYGKKNYIFI